MRVTLIGMGCGGLGPAGPAAGRIASASLLLGARRLLDALPPVPGRRLPCVRSEEILAHILACREGDCAVLYSGDTGFYSGAAGLLPGLRAAGIACELLPGISSVQALASRLGRPWQDWRLASAHGRDCDIVGLVRGGAPVFLLTGGAGDVNALCRALTGAGLGNTRVTVAEDLFGPGERVVSGTAESLRGGRFGPLQVMLAEAAPGLLPGPRVPGLPDDAFLRGDVPMTKQEVRAVILAKLALTPKDLCWDVGAGTGSVAAEMALAAREVWAVERGAEACRLICENRLRLRAWGLHLVRGEAPGVLAALPAPDAVFVGGSGGALSPILDAAARAAAGPLRLCASAVTLETLYEATAWMEARGIAPEITQIAVTRVRPLGGRHMLRAANPVFLIAGTLGEDRKGAGGP